MVKGGTIRLNTDDPNNMPVTEATYGRRKHVPNREHNPRGHTFPIRVPAETLENMRKMTRAV